MDLDFTSNKYDLFDDWHQNKTKQAFTQHFDPSVLSRQTKPHCGLPQLWGQFCLMLLLDFRSVPNGLKKWSIQSNRFLRWIGSQLNLF